MRAWIPDPDPGLESEKAKMAIKKRQKGDFMFSRVG
jgi:hypothetical protein